MRGTMKAASFAFALDDFARRSFESPSPSPEGAHEGGHEGTVEKPKDENSQGTLNGTPDPSSTTSTTSPTSTTTSSDSPTCKKGRNVRSDKLQVSLEEFMRVFGDYVASGEAVLVDGYAPFCKHIFMKMPQTWQTPPAYLEEREWKVLPGRVPLTEEVRAATVHDYHARRAEELPVLTRYLPLERALAMDLPDAQVVDVILYSDEQVRKEEEAMLRTKASIPVGRTAGAAPTVHAPRPRPLGAVRPTAKAVNPLRYPLNAGKIDWHIISLKFQNEGHETPMLPITAMRNALISEGGSGVPIDRLKYMEAVNYWRNHVQVGLQ